tara:strand:- start:50 stop:559 length:510 start_codon:yes stop_codon:yes gene_type:complete
MPLSKIKTNSLSTDAITSAVMPAGSIIQHKKTFFNTGQGFTSNVFADVTGATQTFACLDASSLVKVTVAVMCGGKGSVKILAGSTSLFEFNNSYAIYNQENQNSYDGSSTRDLRNISGFHSPGNTNTITYKFQARAYDSSSANYYFGINELSNSNSYTYSYIECLEIKS